MTTHSITLASVILLLLAEVRPEAVSSQAGTPVDLLPAEHRSEAGRSAEPDSLLDSIASLFGGGPKVAQKKAGPRPGPVYRPQARPQHHQQQQSSVHRPVAVAPPSTFSNNKPFGSSSTAIKRQTTGETGLITTRTTSFLSASLGSDSKLLLIAPRKLDSPDI